MRRPILIASLAAVMLVVAACGDDPLAPFQPEIANLPDNFQFQATGVTNVTTTLEYQWENTGTSANINQSCTVTGGSAILTIFDASTPARAQVYSRNLGDNGTFVTSAGTNGTWLIRVTLTGLSGTLNFRAQKP